MVVIVMGLPGSGKSHLASRLAAMIHADYISSDQVRKKMRANRTYSAKEKAWVYAEMMDQMKQAVKRNENVVLDATFYKGAIRKQFIDEAKDGGGIIFIEVKAEESIIKERLKQKREDSDADFKVYKIIKAQWEPLQERHLILQSTNDNVDDMLQKAMAHLQ
jgi:predicted kinase